MVSKKEGQYDKCSHCNWHEEYGYPHPRGCIYAPQRFTGSRDTTPELHNHLVFEHGFNWDHARMYTSSITSAEKFHESLHITRNTRHNHADEN